MKAESSRIYAVKSASESKRLSQAAGKGSKAINPRKEESETQRRTWPSRQAAEESMRKLKEWIDDDSV